MGGQAQPQAPTLDTAKSKELTRAELEIKRKEIGPTTAAAGEASRSEAGKNMAFALRGFTNPASVIYGDQIKASSDKLKTAQDQLGAIRSGLRQGKMFDQVSAALGDNQKLLAPRALTAAEKTRLQQREKALAAQVAQGQTQLKSLQSRNPVGELTKAFAPEFAARDRLLGDMQGARGSSAEYTRMQQAYGKGLTAQQTESGALGDRLMSEAMAKMDQGGQLSPEAARDATQAARSGMAARGMATGNAGLGAELLNRDRYAREREFQNLGFAQNVQTQDLGRRQTNTAMRDDTNRFNIGLLGTSAQAANAEQARKLALGQDAYNFRLSTNPKLMLSGLGSPYANMTSNAMQMVSGAQFTPQYSGGQFSSGNQGMNMMAGGLGGALSGAAAGSVAGPWGAGIGAAVGLGAGLLASR
jgi:hypothetical protein